MLPSFLCVGAQKAGTTTLHDILVQHPDLFLPEQKETNFFSRDELFSRGTDYYRLRFFGNAKHGQLLGEIDPEYLFSEKVPPRILATLGPNIKLIFIFRNPVDRAYSHYWMSVRRTYEKLSFEKAVQMESRRILESSFSMNHFSYVARGLYVGQLNRYLALFPKKNMKFLLFEEDIVNNRKRAIAEILKWLRVRPLSLNTELRSNPRTIPSSHLLAAFVNRKNIIRSLGKALLPSSNLRLNIIRKLDSMNQKNVEIPPLEQSLAQQIFSTYFKNDVLELESLIGRSLGIWYRRILERT